MKDEPTSNIHHPQNCPLVKFTTNSTAVTIGKKILLPMTGGIYFEKTEDIISLKAEGNYTRLFFADGRKILVCKTLSTVESMINDPLKFIRIHRSYTININRIKQYIRGKGGYVKMENNQEIDVAAGRRETFMAALKQYFMAKP